ncbi:MAG TPA: nuclear transport factor 2 family protein [Nitrolancea sp.]|jgi:hypothetical protein|nr:nuclear transport factor 2 family protein [Nitrolancea sp.]
MDREQQRDPVQEQLDAFNDRDLDHFVAAYHVDAVVEDAAGNILVQGEAAIRALYRQLFDQSPRLHAEIPTRIRVGEYVIDEERISGMVFAGFPPEMHAAMTYHVVEGKIVHVRMLL